MKARTAVGLLLAIATAAIGCSSYSARDKAIDYTALIHASGDGDELLVHALLARGAPVNPPAPDSAGDISYMANQRPSPLQAAAEHGHLKIVQLLIRRGASLDYQCCDSPTPLGYAAREGHVNVVNALLEAGANPDLPGEDQTPLEAARAAGHLEVVQALEKARRQAGL